MVSVAVKNTLQDLEYRVAAKSGKGGSTVIGFVNSDGSLSHSIKRHGSKWRKSKETPGAYIALKLEPMFTRPKRFIVLVGGRGSSKSLAAGDYVAINMHDNCESWLCLREFQSSISDSVHGLIKSEIDRLELDGFRITDNTFFGPGGSKIRFNGLARNPASVKSAFGFKGFWTEEAQSLSANSIKELTPTARKKPVTGLPAAPIEIENDEIDLSQVRQVFCANPASSQDPFSQRFITPFQDALERDGIYEDELHLVIKINWNDNPWFKMSGLDDERQFDLNNLPRAMYDHIWEGAFNDSVENAIIPAEWFDACIDAHEKLGFKPQGAKVVSHDPSDLGGDSKGLALRHGSVILDVQENLNGDVSEGMDWALDTAIGWQCDFFLWDGDGMGAPLRRNADTALDGKPIEPIMFKGSEGPYLPESIYQPAMKTIIRQSAKVKDTFRNKRSQCYLRLADRMYNTYRAVEKGEYTDPDTMISFASSIKNIQKLRSEVCRLPLKPNGNGYIQMMTKPEMKKLGIPSPNMADSVMMTMADIPAIRHNRVNNSRPRAARAAQVRR